jgi:hypothetical protein
MLLAYTGVVVNSVDVVSRLEATFVCLVLHGRGVGERVVTALFVPCIPPTFGYGVDLEADIGWQTS